MVTKELQEFLEKDVLNHTVFLEDISLRRIPIMYPMSELAAAVALLDITLLDFVERDVVTTEKYEELFKATTAKLNRSFETGISFNEYTLEKIEDMLDWSIQNTLREGMSEEETAIVGTVNTCYMILYTAFNLRYTVFPRVMSKGHNEKSEVMIAAAVNMSNTAIKILEVYAGKHNGSEK